MATTTTAPKTTAADRVLDAFRDLPAQTTLQDVAAVTATAKSTVGDALRKLAKDGKVVRMDIDGKVTWTLSPTQKAEFDKAAKRAAAAKASKPKVSKSDKVTKLVETAKAKGTTDKVLAKATTLTAFADVALPEVTVTPTGRRAKGVLDAQVLGWLVQRRSEMFGPYDVAKGVQAKTGAVHPALERLLSKDLIRKPQTERPVRYQAK